MKTRFILFGVFSLSTLFAFAQNSGVYLSASDFASGKLAYEINCSTEKHTIKLNEFLNQDYITVIHDKQSHKLQKKEIFGYKDCDNLTYRFAGNSHYVILNPTEKIILYKHTIEASKNQKEEVHYYFSVSGAGEMQTLTLMNLKKAFPDNHKLHDAIDAEFKSDNELAQYDSFHKQYKVNRLLDSTI
ncbi:MAG: hypothetical protein ABI663_12725 [Chryseolinea sp.]